MRDPYLLKRTEKASGSRSERAITEASSATVPLSCESYRARACSSLRESPVCGAM
jgi:hypothetical protein